MPKLEPVRWYAILAAVIALVAFYVDDLPVALILGVGAAVLGVGAEITRSKTTPTAKSDPPG